MATSHTNDKKTKMFYIIINTAIELFIGNNNYRLRVFFKHLEPSSKFSSGIYSKNYKTNVDQNITIGFFIFIFK